jgi:hypothetical protein
MAGIGGSRWGQCIVLVDNKDMCEACQARFSLLSRIARLDIRIRIPLPIRIL